MADFGWFIKVLQDDPKITYGNFCPYVDYSLMIKILNIF